MTRTQTLTWFARHEITLAWRDWAGMMAGGRTTRERAVTIVVLVFVLGLHWLAYALLKPSFAKGVTVDKSSLIVLTVMLLTTFSMMMSQALEHVTRAFYARADLDLILSSPAPSQHVFAIRIAALAATGAVMTSLLAAPLINMATVIDGPRWLSAYALIAASSAIATSIALALAMTMFRMIGPKRTRLIAQIFAAVIGAALLIALQVFAVLAYGNLSRTAILQSPAVVAMAPDASSLVWLPARALLGEWQIGAAMLAAALCVLILTTGRYAPIFASHAIAAAGAAERDDAESIANTKRVRPFIQRTTAGALRHKEWMLLGRDPWLISQTLMQILYLLPPALLLWRDMGSDHATHIILTPVLVMAFGQLAGGLSWLALSGEDAADLVATAPLSGQAQLRAKVEAVLAVIFIGALPFLAGLAAFSLWGAAVAAAGIVIASASAILIQMWFKVSAKRTMFRRRQTSSKAATFAEAFSSIFWAAAAGFAAYQSWFAIGFVILALLTLAMTAAIRPRA
jgi:ABC-2 type transport system permease protein